MNCRYCRQTPPRRWQGRETAPESYPACLFFCPAVPFTLQFVTSTCLRHVLPTRITRVNCSLTARRGALLRKSYLGRYHSLSRTCVGVLRRVGLFNQYPVHSFSINSRVWNGQVERSERSCWHFRSINSQPRVVFDLCLVNRVHRGFRDKMCPVLKELISCLS